MDNQLLFGLNRPENPKSGPIWGARGILTNGRIDIPPDRYSWAPCSDEDPVAKSEFARELSVAMKTARTNLVDLYRQRVFNPRIANEMVLYKTTKVTIIANTNASGGYLYLVAFPTPEKDNG